MPLPPVLFLPKSGWRDVVSDEQKSSGADFFPGGGAEEGVKLFCGAGKCRARVLE